MNTLKSLIETLGPVKKADKTPTSRKLREEAGEPFISTDHILIYACGYAVYENESGRTVMWVPDCTNFTYHFNKLTEPETQYMNETEALPDGMLEELPWELVLTMIGDHRIEANSMNRAGSRSGRADFQSQDDGDKDGDIEDAIEESYRKEFKWRGDRIGESPETIYIRKEAREEVLAAMTDKQRKVFVLYYDEGYRQQEIADMMGISHQAVCKLLDKALRCVRKKAC